MEIKFAHLLARSILICYTINSCIKRGLNVSSPASPTRFCSVLKVIQLGGNKSRKFFRAMKISSYFIACYIFNLAIVEEGITEYL